MAALHEEKLLWFAPDTGGWLFDLERIRAKGYADNVLELVAGRMHRLSAACRRTLQVLACLGIRVDDGVLFRALDGPKEKVAVALAEAERAGLLLTQEGGYTFVHDRIREAAYASIAATERPREHVRLGRLLLSGRTAEEVGDEVFELVNHFNRGLGLLAGAAEREQVRRLNVRAGRRSKAAIAYAAAREYLAQASELLTEDAWTKDYDDAYATFLELAECEYLVGRFERADALFRELIEKARSDLDRAKVLRLRVMLYEVSGQNVDALEAGLAGLRLLGFIAPDTAEDIGKALEAEKAKLPSLLAGRRIADLALEPEVSDPRVRVSLDLIADTLASAYQVKPELYPWLSVLGLTLSLRHGNAASSCVSYSTYAMVVLGYGRDIPSALAFSELSLALNSRFRDVTRKPSLLFLLGGGIGIWTYPLRACKAILEQASEAALQAGDHNFALYSALHMAWIEVEAAESVEKAQDHCRKYRALADRLRSDLPGVTARLFEQYFLCLQEWTLNPMGLPASFKGAAFKEQDALETFRKLGSELGLHFYYVLKLSAAFNFGRFAEALDHADKAWEFHGKRPLVLLCNATHVFYHALTLTAFHPQVTPERQAEFATRLEGLLAQLKYWADHCPENFQSRHALVLAEKASLEGRDMDAMKGYAQAIASARDNGFLFLEGLACELAARFYLGRGLDTNAYAHLRIARAAYVRWGGHAKVAHLDHSYPGIEAPTHPGPTATLAGSLGRLDLANVVKASQALSGEMDPEKLVETLMSLVMNHAGA
ncbi:MAG: hypothetical protein ABI560_14085, partial [Myxococcales bacterium]